MLTELYEERTEGEELELELAAEMDELGVRRCLIRLEQLERDLKQTKERRAAIAEVYDRELSRFQMEIDLLRSGVQAWVERNGKIRFPDVGTAYLAKSDPKIEVEDREAFVAEFGKVFVKGVFDETAAKQYALELALSQGVIVPGARLVPGGPSIRVRKA